MVAERIRSALRGENTTVMARMRNSIAVIGDVQFLPGYSLLLPEEPTATRLTDLSRDARRGYLESVDLLAEAVELACAERDATFRRVNIEILGNSDPCLHTHLWPRYGWEDADRLADPVWLYPMERWHDSATALGPEHDPLKRAIARHLERLMRPSQG